MGLTGFDHIVLVVRDVEATCAFYRDVVGMTPYEERPGKYALSFGANKISLQSPSSVPEIARNTTPGSANFCVLTDDDMESVISRLTAANVLIVTGPGERSGATGPIWSVYFHDPDGNLVEIAKPIDTD